ncbi:hypothetical protein, partial [Cryobacterium sp. Hh7]|uniref:hypothetical protein n=1 Tax=Cryobacterium sp. Hh7 TaxID=1259159 RepID=UPI001A7EEF58
HSRAVHRPPALPCTRNRATKSPDWRYPQALLATDLAAAADVDRTVLSAIERGKPVESIAAIRRVLRALHIEPVALPAPKVS